LLDFTKLVRYVTPSFFNKNKRLFSMHNRPSRSEKDITILNTLNLFCSNLLYFGQKHPINLTD